MPPVLTADERWAQRNVDEQVGELFSAMLTATSCANGALEFGKHLPTEKLKLDRDVRAQIALTVEALQNLYHRSEQA